MIRTSRTAAMVGTLVLLSAWLIAGCYSEIGDFSRAHESPLANDLAAIGSQTPGQPVLVVGRLRVPEGSLDCPG